MAETIFQREALAKVECSGRQCAAPQSHENGPRLSYRHNIRHTVRILFILLENKCFSVSRVVISNVSDAIETVFVAQKIKIWIKYAKYGNSWLLRVV